MAVNPESVIEKVGEMCLILFTGLCKIRLLRNVTIC